MPTNTENVDCKYCALLRESMVKEGVNKANIMLVLEAHKEASHNTLSRIFLEKIYDMDKDKTQLSCKESVASQDCMQQETRRSQSVSAIAKIKSVST
jgi:hypothetical protein